MEAETEPLTSVVLELEAKPESDIITKHCWKAAIWNKPQSYVSLFAVLFSLTVFSHKALWKEEKDHLLKWNLRSDGLELVEGEQGGIHPRGGGGTTDLGEVAVRRRGELNPHSHLWLWAEWMETSHAVQLWEIWLIQSSKAL